MSDTARAPEQLRSAAQATAASPKRQAILVLGMHRSGTSAIAGMLVKLGAEAPKTLLPANQSNPKGHWESTELVALHDELLASAGTTWDDWRPFSANWYETRTAAAFKQRAKAALASEFGSSACFVLKDPRICRFARFWLDIFAEEGIAPRIILPVRQPLEVALSLRARSGLSLNCGLLLWLRHVLDAEAASRNLPRIVLDWDSLLKDWRSAANRMAAILAIRWSELPDHVAGDVDLFLTPELRHECVSDKASRLSADMHEWAICAYDVLKNIARGRKTNDAYAILDQIAVKFNEGSHLFGRALASLEIDLAQRDGSIVRLERELGEKQARIDELMHELTQRKNVLAERVEKVARLEYGLAQSHSRIGEMARDLAESEALIGKLAAVITQHRKDIDTLQRELRERRKYVGFAPFVHAPRELWRFLRGKG